MFKDGLNRLVTIIPMVYNTSNRTNRNQAKNDIDIKIEHVPCRISKNEKAILPITHENKVLEKLNKGCVLIDEVTKEEWTIKDGYCVYGKCTAHHWTYQIETKVI